MTRYALSITAAALLAACGGSQPPVSAPLVASDAGDSLPHHKTFHYTGKKQSFKVPIGVTQIKVVALGAAGGGEATSGHRYPYIGRGGRVHAIIPVTPGERLYVYVGGQGSYTTGGFNGGGTPGDGPGGRNGYGGGGASDVREGGNRLNDRILVAGAGAGQGDYGPAGQGGAGGGATGGIGGGYGSYGQGGGGGTQDRGGEGGAGGVDYHPGSPGNAGTLGNGGSGGQGAENTGDNAYSGGGGGGAGGGYYGGGGGGGGGAAFGSIYGQTGGGGGGGSSYVEPTAIKFHMWRGWKTATGEGLVVISWQ